MDKNETLAQLTDGIRIAKRTMLIATILAELNGINIKNIDINAEENILPKEHRHYYDMAARFADKIINAGYNIVSKQTLNLAIEIIKSSSGKTALIQLDSIRKKGWVVAIHNDYKVNGMPYTFWLFTKDPNLAVKGEGINDNVALSIVMTEINKLESKK
jgi:hypothetical protein